MSRISLPRTEEKLIQKAKQLGFKVKGNSIEVLDRTINYRIQPDLFKGLLKQKISNTIRSEDMMTRPEFVNKTVANFFTEELISKGLFSRLESFGYKKLNSLSDLIPNRYIQFVMVDAQGNAKEGKHGIRFTGAIPKDLNDKFYEATMNVHDPFLNKKKDKQDVEIYSWGQVFPGTPAPLVAIFVKQDQPIMRIPKYDKLQFVDSNETNLPTNNTLAKMTAFSQRNILDDPDHQIHCVIDNCINYINSKLDQNPSNRKTLERTVKQLELMKPQYPDGMSLAEIEDDICKKFRISFRIDIIGFGTPIYLPQEKDKKSLIHIHFLNEKFNHFDLNDKPQDISLEPKEFQKKMNEFLEQGYALKIKSTQSHDIKQFKCRNLTYLNKQYDDERLKSKIIYEYLHDIRQYMINASTPCTLIYKQANHFPQRTLIQNLKDEMYSYDANKLYYNFNKHEYYRGIPVQANCWIDRPTIEFAIEHIGVYAIQSKYKIFFNTEMSGFHSSYTIRWLHEHGFKFEVIAGMYNCCDAFIPEEVLKFSPDMLRTKAYALLVGKLSSDNDHRITTYVVKNKHEILEKFKQTSKSGFGDLCYYTVYEKTSNDVLTGYNISCHMLALANCIVWDMAYKYKRHLLAINVDALIFDRPIPEILESPLWKDEGLLSPEKVDKMKTRYSWCATLFSRYGYETKDYKALVQKYYDDGIIIPTVMPFPISYYSGAGGTGKSYCVSDEEDFFNPTYTTQTNKLADEKRGKLMGQFYKSYTINRAVTNVIGGVNYGIRNFTPAVLFMDEVTLLPDYHNVKGSKKIDLFYGLINELVSKGCRIILAGDSAQIPSSFIDIEKRMAYLNNLPQREFKKDYRSICEKTAEFKQIIREATLDTGVTNQHMQQFIFQNIKTTDQLNENQIHVCFNGLTAEKFNGVTIDKLQGCTIELPTQLIIHTGSLASKRSSQYKQLIYTSISRVRSFDQIYLWSGAAPNQKNIE